MIEMNAFQDVLLRAIPEDWQKMSGVPFSEVATHVGRVALAFVDPVVVLTATVWGVTRGSDAVSGQLERGTLEMILAQPVRRRALYSTQAFATICGGFCLCVVLYASVFTAIQFGPWSGKVNPLHFLPAAFNVFGLMVCMSGLATCVSSWDSYRWRTIGILCAFYVTSLLTKLIGRLSETLNWVGYFSVFNAYEPQRLVGGDVSDWKLLLQYNGILLGIGITGYVIGGYIFSRRDLPAPL
ncbi:MAG: ABC transporter permease subunit [Pirellulales bacterium]|nr:ABC transporter permease subunit [Pirellulales bacterium]